LLSRCLYRVLRDGKYTEIPVEDVVPGDVVVLKPGIVYCDMVVLKGFRVLVDESALTGEATPLLKAEIDPAMRHVPYLPAHHKVCTISAGTEIIELDDSGKILGLVMTTGSFTAKGELLSDVLSYQRQNFQHSDEVKVILFILALQAVVMISLVFYFLQSSWFFSWFYGTWRKCPAMQCGVEVAESSLLCIRFLRPRDNLSAAATNCVCGISVYFSATSSVETDQLPISRGYSTGWKC
jgi:magnesium-transporting ATPase (P-type)